MLAKIDAASVRGIEAFKVEVEVHVGYSDSCVVIVGLPDAAVRESILFETRVIQAGLGPRFGHGMDLHIGDEA